MTKPTISLIAAMAKGRVIGHNNQLPWHIPEDLQHFKRHTQGKPVVMGRKTFESIGKPLPGRANVIITRNENYEVPGCHIVHSLSQALEVLQDAPEIMIVGGAEIYAQALPKADKLILTFIDLEVEGDTFFPTWDEQQWQECSRQEVAPIPNQTPGYSFVEYQRAQE